MSNLQIEQINCLSDNYGYLVHDPESGETACIDTPETAPILDRLAQKGWVLSHIWNTHHHYDHAGNNLEIKQATGCQIIGPAGEADKIPGIDRAVDDGDVVQLGAHQAHILNVGGHTLGHIAYHLPATAHAFVGDSLLPSAADGCLKAPWRKCGAVCRNSRPFHAQHKFFVPMNIPPQMPLLPLRLTRIIRICSSALPKLPPCGRRTSQPCQPTLELNWIPIHFYAQPTPVFASTSIWSALRTLTYSPKFALERTVFNVAIASRLSGATPR